MCNNEIAWICCVGVLYKLYTFPQKKYFFSSIDFRLFYACKVIFIFLEKYLLYVILFMNTFIRLQNSAAGLISERIKLERFIKVSGWSLISSVLDLTDHFLNFIWHGFLKNGTCTWGFPVNLERVLDIVSLKKKKQTDYM